MNHVGLCIFQAHFPDCKQDGDKDNERNRVEENVCSGRIWWLLLSRTKLKSLGSRVVNREPDPDLPLTSLYRGLGMWILVDFLD